MKRQLVLPLCLLGVLLFPVQKAEAAELTVMSFNILHGTNADGQPTLEQQAQAIADAKPDIVGLQEVDMQCTRSASVDQMAYLARKTGLHQAYSAHFDYQGGSYGIGLLSRYPLADVQGDRISLITNEGTTETRALLSAVAKLDDGTSVVVATVHMGLNERTRNVQAREIVDKLGQRGGPVILTGDLNALPDSPEIRELESFFVNVGDPKLHTFPAGKPVKTIDYILVDKGSFLSAGDFKVHEDVRSSDHYPISARVQVKTSGR